MKFDTTLYEEKMKKTISALSEELGGIRVGRASAKVLDKIKVPYYGSMTSLDGVATVKALDARTLSITPWETSVLKEIEKAILASDLGINPQNDGKMIRLVFPSLTEDRRKDLTKQVAKMGEEAKVALRNIRRDANEKAKEQKKSSILTEDEEKSAEKSIQDLTDRFIKEIDVVVDKKDKEILEI
ncbi:MAG: ribosome recycling factor [Clostridiales bacterium GWF2_36_10]|nr:MAG: ribosome recycling factor [Clostridiales bacterium GWF2_36_10]HAN21312.1 ribosome recycling factor [Clostridiales bacterium]